MKNNPGKSFAHGFLLLLLVLMTPYTARAAGEGEIQNYLISINRLYESLDYELALNRVQLARHLPRGTEEEVTLSLYEGMVLCDMGKKDQGASAFRAALLLRPDAKLPVQGAPKVAALFESVRKQVKAEVAPFLAQREARSPPSKPAPAPTAPSAPPAPAADPQADCGPEPSPVPSRNLRELQLGRLARMKYGLCTHGRFQGPVAAKWSDLKTRMEDAKTSHERTLISQEIDQFNREVGTQDVALKPKAEPAVTSAVVASASPPAPEKERRADKPQTDMSGCQTAVRADCEKLMQQLLRSQEAFLRTTASSKLVPLRELVKIGQQIRAADTTEALRVAALALDDWQQRQSRP